ncbi:MAG: FeoB-associated Cys-rich membrane protein [Deltaproteobacteria bacterium]|nr:FeoB-associated Cys-rich membrane protein [Deltaproteobacteria bacterium]
MAWNDLLLAGALIVGSLYLLYRSVWKKRGYCQGCTSETCPGKPENKNC